MKSLIEQEMEEHDKHFTALGRAMRALGEWTRESRTVDGLWLWRRGDQTLVTLPEGGVVIGEGWDEDDSKWREEEKIK